MKRVAGRLKLELSQYRELEAFAQFGSDLDADTQRTLARGERLVRTLNQGERQPLAVEDQVLQVYAATNGFLDRILVDRVPEFLADLVARAHSQHRELRDEDRRRRLVRGDAGGGARGARRVRRATSATTSTRRASRPTTTPPPAAAAAAATRAAEPASRRSPRP